MVSMYVIYEACSEAIETIAILSKRLNSIKYKVYEGRFFILVEWWI